MLINALVKVTAGIADVICIAQITYKGIHNTLLIDHGWLRLLRLALRSSPSLRLLKTGCRMWSILLLKSERCFFTMSADLWSLNSKTIRWILSV